MRCRRCFGDSIDADIPGLLAAVRRAPPLDWRSAPLAFASDRRSVRTQTRGTPIRLRTHQGCSKYQLGQSMAIDVWRASRPIPADDAKLSRESIRWSPDELHPGNSRVGEPGAARSRIGERA